MAGDLETPAVIKTLARGGLRPRIAMRGKSMVPALREGMVLELAAFERTRSRIGEIIVFRDGTRLVAHRVVEVLGDGTIRTSGDAQPWICERIAPLDVIGIVAAVFENDRVSAPRVDTVAFRRGGAVIARSRALRAALLRPVALGRTLLAFLPWQRPPLFATLHAALAGCERGDAAEVARALVAADEDSLAAFAYRHTCETLLRRALTLAQANPTPALPITMQTRRLADALQADARLGGLRNVALRAQIEAVVGIFQASGVPFALLKGAARLYGADPDEALYSSRDIDIFVPLTSLDDAIGALCGAGYVFKVDERERQEYRERIHHAAPLFPPNGMGWAVELHTRLARPGWLSTDTTWDALATHLQPIEGRCGPVLAFDRFGTVLHHLIHGIGLARYRDVIVAARGFVGLSADERERLTRIVRAETREPVRLSAMLALAARVAGETLEPSPDVRAYLAWVARRESLPRSLRRGSYAIEAWYATGGRIRRLGPMIVLDLGSPARVIARLLLAPVTWSYARAMRT